MISSTGQRLLPQLRRMALNADTTTTDAELLGAFVANHDEQAFVAIVQRHGPMVRQVCLRVVGEPHLAEDAFQAVFMVLARRAANVQPREMLGHWLYGVARRTALKARVGYWRQRCKEKQVDVMPHSPTMPDEIWADLQPVLDEEIARLSDKHRMVLVLCDLEGRPQRQVARELKLPPATVANRLAAARKTLAKRLTGRGIALSASSLAMTLHLQQASATIPTGIAGDLARWACRVAWGEPLAGVVPPTVNQLTEGVLKMFAVAKLKKATVGVLSGLLFAAGFTTMATSPLSAEPSEKVKPAKTFPTNQPPKTDTIDDQTFLRRLSLDLRGIVPTAVELRYFTTDNDRNKRGKVTEWMLIDQPPKTDQLQSHELLWLQHKHSAWTTANNCAACHQGTTWKNWTDANFRVDLDTFWANSVRGWAVPDADKKLTTNNWASITATVEDKPRKVYGERLNTLRDKRGEVTQLRDELDYFEAVQSEPMTKPTEARLLEFTQRVELIDESQQSVPLRVYFDVVDATTLEQKKNYLFVQTRTVTDSEFLKRAFADILGVPPTKLEERYFLADKDSAKRDKLLDWLLSQSQASKPHDKVLGAWLGQPEMRKKWIADWKARLDTIEHRLTTEPYSVNIRMRQTDSPLQKLLTELLQTKRSDAQILEALMLATMGRLPTETERDLIVAGLPHVGDRATAWHHILCTLSSTNDAKSHAKFLTEQAKDDAKK